MPFLSECLRRGCEELAIHEVFCILVEGISVIRNLVVDPPQGHRGSLNARMRRGRRTPRRRSKHQSALDALKNSQQDKDLREIIGLSRRFREMDHDGNGCSRLQWGR